LTYQKQNDDGKRIAADSDRADAQVYDSLQQLYSALKVLSIEKDLDERGVIQYIFIKYRGVEIFIKFRKSIIL
jgi:hypothetical protein